MEDEWFEISDSDWLEDGFIKKELKLLVDAQFPQYNSRKACIIERADKQ